MRPTLTLHPAAPRPCTAAYNVFVKSKLAEIKAARVAAGQDPLPHKEAFKAAVEKWSALSKEQQDEFKKQVRPGGLPLRGQAHSTVGEAAAVGRARPGFRLATALQRRAMQHASDAPALRRRLPSQVADKLAAGGEDHEDHSAEPSAEAAAGSGDDSGSSDSSDESDSD